MLIELKSLFKSYVCLTVREISFLLKVSPELARDLVFCYVNKGKVKHFQKNGRCQSLCSKCDPLTTEIFEWIA